MGATSKKEKKPLVTAEKRDYLLSVPAPETWQDITNICIGCMHSRLIRHCRTSQGEVQMHLEILCGAQFNRPIEWRVLTCELFDSIPTEETP